MDMMGYEPKVDGVECSKMPGFGAKKKTQCQVPCYVRPGTIIPTSPVVGGQDLLPGSEGIHVFFICLDLGLEHDGTIKPNCYPTALHHM